VASADVSLKLPAGFKATVVASNLGRARHIAVNSNGDVYVKLERLKDGKGIIRLRDTNGDGVADEQFAFGNYAGTGIAISNGYLYASSDEEVFRYKLNDKSEVENPDAPEKIVTGLVNRRQHASKSIALDGKGFIYVNIGAPSNACQETDRTAGSPGRTPCPILETAGGIWQFRIDKLNQSYADGVRYATGLRNVVGLDWNTSANELYVTQHGRDQLNQLHPTLYNNEQRGILYGKERNGFWMALLLL
jgi:glucose/arabinose dehydrogenase